MTRNLVLALAGALLFVSCETNLDQNSKKIQVEVGINLNHGEKWKVNPEMKPHIEKGKELLTEYISEKESNHQKLAEDLKAQNNSLIQSCNMKGESHNELHKWLHPHIELVKSLTNAKNSDEVEKIISRLQESFNIYNDYFE